VTGRGATSDFHTSGEVPCSASVACRAGERWSGSSNASSGGDPHPEENAIITAAPELADYVAGLKQRSRKVITLALRQTDYSELGRFLVTKNREGIGAFKTPFLRDVLLTGPYMHDGSLETLWDVVEFFNKGGEQNPFLDAQMKPLGLTESEADDIVNFLSALTSDRFADQRAAELDRQHTTYLYRLALQRQTRKGSQ
jgi:cytochrome c peroxidase